MNGPRVVCFCGKEHVAGWCLRPEEANEVKTPYVEGGEFMFPKPKDWPTEPRKTQKGGQE
jgi:hypothetical protein